MSIEAIRNYRYVSDTIATSGQPEDDQFKFIAQAGYHVVINLAMPNSDFAIPEEGNIVSALKMSYVHIPVPFDAPHVSHLQEFFNIVNVYADKKIWIHCALNHRVSAFLYLYKTLVLNESPQHAMRVMLPAWEPDGIWQAFMAMPRERMLDGTIGRDS